MTSSTAIHVDNHALHLFYCACRWSLWESYECHLAGWMTVHSVQCLFYSFVLRMLPFFGKTGFTWESSDCDKFSGIFSSQSFWCLRLSLDCSHHITRHTMFDCWIKCLHSPTYFVDCFVCLLVKVFLLGWLNCLLDTKLTMSPRPLLS